MQLGYHLPAAWDLQIIQLETAQKQYIKQQLDWTKQPVATPVLKCPDIHRSRRKRL